MTTRTLTVTVLDADQVAVGGAVVTARLSDLRGRPLTDYIAAGTISVRTVTATANASGVATLELTPNTIGSQDLRYLISATDPDTGSVLIRSAGLDGALIQMPDADATLHALVPASGVLPTALVTIEDTITGAPGTDALVENLGTSSNVILRFTIPGGTGPAGADGSDGEDGAPGADGADGDDGWTPIFAAVSDGARRVLQVSDWTGGEGTKPATGQYVGPLGLVSVIGDAIDIRGAAGADGSDGASGSDGADGAAGSDGSDGDDGWAPILATVSDGARRVLQVNDWTGGTGTKPGTGDYLGPTGFVATAAEAVDIRGATGAQGDTGATGDAGPTGDTGPAGADGADGSNGADGDDGWAPVLALVSDSERRVLQVTDWAGGTGTKPATGDYVGASGLTSTIGDAIDVRGATGATGDTGATGATGAAGADGDDGVDGADGDQIKGHRTYSGTTDTPTAADAGKVIRSTGASDSTVTINNGVFADNDVVTLRQAGAGVPTLAEGTNVTLNGDLSVGGQDTALQWVCVSTGATDVFDVYGGVE